MRPIFEELDHQTTRLGEISLRRRLEPVLQVDVWEARLDDEFLMSSLFTVAEIALADLGLAALPGAEPASLDVAVGGLGLGYTALAALADPRVRTVQVVEALEAVIGWHRDELLPESAGLAADERTEFVPGDFFALVAAGQPFSPGGPARHHAILLDVDHAPDRVLHPSHAAFYEPTGLARVRDRLHPGGVFALWSDDLPDPAFEAVVTEVFGACASHVVPFPNPYAGGESTNSVYVAANPT